jgi:O-antigen ligase
MDYKFKFHLIFKREQVLYYLDILICLCLTFSIVSSQYNSLLSFLCLKFVLILSIIRMAHNYNIERQYKTIILLVILFLFIQFISSLASDNSRQSVTVLKIRAIYYTAFFASIIFIKNQIQIKAVLVSLLLFTSLISIIEIYYFAEDLLSFHLLPSESRIGYFGQPITVAEIKMLVLLIIFPFFLIKEEFPVQKGLLIFLSVPIFISFMFTGSRGPFVALIIGIMIIGFLKNRKIVYGVLLFLVVYFLFVPESVNGRILNINNINNRSNTARLYMLETGFKSAQDNLIFGVGSVNLKNIYEKYKKASIWGEGDQLHNNVMQILVTMGLFGLLIWLALMFYIFRKLIEIYKKTKTNNVLNALTISSLAAMIAFQVSGLTDWNFADYPVVVVFWFSLSLAFISQKLLNESSAI